MPLVGPASEVTFLIVEPRRAISLAIFTGWCLAFCRRIQGQVLLGIAQLGTTTRQTTFARGATLATGAAMGCVGIEVNTGSSTTSLALRASIRAGPRKALLLRPADLATDSAIRFIDIELDALLCTSELPARTIELTGTVLAAVPWWALFTTGPTVGGGAREIHTAGSAERKASRALAAASACLAGGTDGAGVSTASTVGRVRRSIDAQPLTAGCRSQTGGLALSVHTEFSRGTALPACPAMLRITAQVGAAASARHLTRSATISASPSETNLPRRNIARRLAAATMSGIAKRIDAQPPAPHQPGPARRGTDAFPAAATVTAGLSASPTMVRAPRKINALGSTPNPVRRASLSLLLDPFSLTTVGTSEKQSPNAQRKNH